MRLDKFLKVSRIIKRRTVANEACVGGRVSINGRVAKASADVKVGDIIEIAFGTDTNICVLQTLSTAYYLGYNIIVPEDACTNELGVGTHEGAIDYFVRCYGARIVSTETIIDEIKAVI